MNELVEYIADDLNVSTPETKARILRTLNVRYKQVTSSIGLIPSRRVEREASTTQDDRFVTFANIEKLDGVFYKSSDVDPAAKATVLTQVTVEEMLELPVRVDPPRCFCIYNVDATSVTIQMDVVPENSRILYAVGLSYSTTLTGNEQPAFPESFHDILLHGVKADEYRRRDKAVLAKDSEMLFQQRLSDLRLFIAKSAYLEIYNGKLRGPEDWWDSEGKRY